jgi:hypothetical protein
MQGSVCYNAFAHAPAHGSIVRPSTHRKYSQKMLNGNARLQSQLQPLVAKQLPLRAERRPYLVVRSINGGVNGTSALAHRSA